MILQKVSRHTDLRNTVITVQRICNLSREDAIEKVKNCPQVLLSNVSDARARKLDALFQDMQAVVLWEPDLPPPPQENPTEPMPSEDKQKDSQGAQKVHRYSLLIIALLVSLMGLTLTAGALWILRNGKDHKLPSLSANKKGTQIPERFRTGDTKIPDELSRRIGRVIQLTASVRSDQAQKNWKDYGSGNTEIPDEDEDKLPDPRLTQALQILRESDSLFPGHPEISRWKGYIYQQKGMYARAEQYYRKAVSITPGNPIYLNLLGNVKVERGQYSQADYIFRQSFKADSTQAATLKNLAVVNLFYLQDSNAAMVYLQKYIAQEPQNDFDYLALRGEAAAIIWNRYNGRATFALLADTLPFTEYELKRRSLQGRLQNKATADLHLQLARLYIARRMLAAAETELEKAWKSDEGLVEVYRLLALLQGHLGKFEPLMGSLRRGVRHAPKTPWFQRNLALLYKYYEGSCEKAWPHFVKYLKFSPTGSMDSPDLQKQIWMEANDCKDR